MAKVDTILEEIKGLTLLEASDLVKKMEEAFGVFRGSGHGSLQVAAEQRRARLLRKRRRNSTVVLTDVGGKQDQRHQGGFAKSPAWA